MLASRGTSSWHFQCTSKNNSIINKHKEIHTTKSTDILIVLTGGTSSHAYSLNKSLNGCRYIPVELQISFFHVQLLMDIHLRHAILEQNQCSIHVEQ